MTTERRVVGGLLAVIAMIILSHGRAVAKGKTDIEIRPGPTTMSEEERAIKIDPAHGIEHGVILVEETERNEDLGTDNRIGYHLRAKVLSTEGASVGNIEIRQNIMVGDVIEWWGRTILPDGTVLKLPQGSLKEQHVAQPPGEHEIRHLKGALPGIVPGSVIDYGYVYRGESGSMLEDRIALQRAWPIRHFNYRWIPYSGWHAAFRVVHAEHLPVKNIWDKNSVLITGADLPPFREEPWMPPKPEVQPATILYYVERNKDVRDFWNEEARRTEERARYFIRRGEGRLRKAIEALNLSAEAPLASRLTTVYDWICANVKNLSRKSLQESEAEARVGKAKTKDDEIVSVADVLEKRKGNGLALNYLFLGFARALGADAHIIKIPNRMDHYWDESRFDTHQLDVAFVAVRSKDSDEITVVDPGAGLAYGQVPWWYMGTNGMLATVKGSQSVLVPPTPAHRSVSNTKVQIAFADDNESSRIRWTRQATGQNWYSDREAMRTMDPISRKKRLEEICGGRSFDLSRADATGPEGSKEGFEVICEGEDAETGMTGEVTTYTMSTAGPWIEAIPELTAQTRIFPVIFDYPHTDIMVLDVEAPHGFVPRAAPPPVKLEGGFGNYLLSVTTTETGYHVERTFTLVPLRVEPIDYPGLRAFLADARQTDKTRLVFDRVGKKQ